MSQATTGGFAMFLRQLQGVLRIEVKKQLWDKRALAAYILCGMVLLIVILDTLVYTSGNDPRYIGLEAVPAYLGEVRAFFNALFFWFLLKGAVFFGCLSIFLGLFRSELLDRSLHYYFLTPMRREGLVLGKYLAGLISTAFLFCTCTVLCLLIAYIPVFLAGGELTTSDIWAPGQYAGITLMACTGYGATFLLFGFFIRNSIVPSVIFCVWEWLSFLLPPIMQRFTVVHYLKSLLPLDIRTGPVAVVSDPTPLIWSAPCMTLYAALAIGLVCLRIRWMDIRYS